jgi:hypothetical protein
MRISRWMPIAAIAVVIFIVLAVAVAVPLAWYGWHRWQLYDIAEQDACAQRYLPIFQLTILEKLPSAKVRLDALAPVGGPLGITNDEKAKRIDALAAAEADYTARIKKRTDQLAAIEEEVRQRWEVGIREFIFRYFERHPWMRPIDPADLPHILSTLRAI